MPEKRYLLAASLLCGAVAVSAHDIPSDVNAQILLKPEATHLDVIVRVPLAAIRDVEFPELAGGYLDVEKLAPRLPDAAKVWIADFVGIRAGERQLEKPAVAATQISLASDRSLETFESALAHVRGPELPNSSQLVWNQVMLDVLLEYPLAPGDVRYSVRPGLERLGARVVTAVRFFAPDGVVRAYEFTGDP